MSPVATVTTSPAVTTPAVTTLPAVTTAPAVTTMPAMTEHVHSDKSAPEQYPEPIVQHPLHVDIPCYPYRLDGS